MFAYFQLFAYNLGRQNEKQNFSTFITCMHLDFAQIMAKQLKVSKIFILGIYLPADYCKKESGRSV